MSAPILTAVLGPYARHAAMLVAKRFNAAHVVDADLFGRAVPWQTFEPSAPVVVFSAAASRSVRRTLAERASCVVRANNAHAAVVTKGPAKGEFIQLEPAT